MSEESIGGTPRSFLIIGIVALLWNLVGVASYLMHVMIGPEALASMQEAERALMESTPAWANGVFAIAVFAGLSGCVGLLLKKAWSVPLFLVSLVAMIVQFSHWLFMTTAVEVYGSEAYTMPVLVTVIGIFLVWYSRDTKGKGWLQ